MKEKTIDSILCNVNLEKALEESRKKRAEICLRLEKLLRSEAVGMTNEEDIKRITHSFLTNYITRGDLSRLYESRLTLQILGVPSEFHQLVAMAAAIEFTKDHSEK